MFFNKNKKVEYRLTLRRRLACMFGIHSFTKRGPETWGCPYCDMKAKWEGDKLVASGEYFGGKKRTK